MAKNVKQKPEQEEEELYEEVEETGGLLEQIETFFVENTNLAIGIGAGVLLLIVGIFGFRFFQQAQDTTAQEEMFSAVYAFEEDSLDLAVNGDGSHFGLLDIEQEYGGTPAANQARYYLGIAAFKQGNIDEAIDYLEGVSEGSNILTMAKYGALGFAYQEIQDFEASAKAFRKAATYPGETEDLTPRWLFEAGKAYEMAGEPEEALDLYEQIKADYPKSQEATNIEKYIGRVSP